MGPTSSKQTATHHDPCYILVFGSSGVGKTSMLNALTGENQPTSNLATGCTFQTTCYEPVAKNGVQYRFIDTAGLNEASSGTVHPRKAQKALIDLLVSSKNGLNLLILTMRSGTILQSDKNNYLMFVDAMTQRKVPTICVITYCENIEPMSKYAEDNKPYFDKQQMKFEKIVSICFAKGGWLEKQYEPLRTESTEIVWKAVEDYASKTPIKFMATKGTGLIKAFKRSWNSFCDLIKMPKWKAACGDIHDVLDRMGIKDKQLREELAKEFEARN